MGGASVGHEPAPVVSESGVVDAQVSASLDDGHSSSTAFAPTSSAVQTGNNTNDGWHRFLNVDIPQGANIDVAFFSLHARTSAPDGPGVKTNLYAEDVDDAVAPVDRADHVAKARTTAFTAWDDENLSTSAFVDSPSIVDVIKEIVDRGTWASGNALQILHDDDTSDAGKYYDTDSYDGEPVSAAKLHAEWST